MLGLGHAMHCALLSNSQGGTKETTSSLTTGPHPQIWLLLLLPVQMTLSPGSHDLLRIPSPEGNECAVDSQGQNRYM